MIFKNAFAALLLRPTSIKCASTTNNYFILLSGQELGAQTRSVVCFPVRLSDRNGIRRDLYSGGDNFYDRDGDDFQQKKDNNEPKKTKEQTSAENRYEIAPTSDHNFSTKEAPVPPNSTDDGEQEIRYDSSRSGSNEPLKAHLTWNGDIEVFQLRDPDEKYVGKNQMFFDYGNVPSHSVKTNPTRVDLSTDNFVYTNANTSGLNGYRNPQVRVSSFEEIGSGFARIGNPFGFQNQQVPSSSFLGFQNQEAGNFGLPTPTDFQNSGLPSQTQQFQSLEEISNYYHVNPANYLQFYNQQTALLSQNFATIAPDQNLLSTTDQVQVDPEFQPTTQMIQPKKNFEKSQNFDFTRKEPAAAKQPLLFSPEKMIPKLPIPRKGTDQRMSDILLKTDPPSDAFAASGSTWTIEEPRSNDFYSKAVSVTDLEQTFFKSKQLSGRDESAKNGSSKFFQSESGKIWLSIKKKLFR